MNLNLDLTIAEKYTSNAQKARVLTENWIDENMFCPRCGNRYLKHFENNKPVADFYCPACNCEYEIKSKKDSFGKKVADGAYETMIKRITSSTNPDFMLLNYTDTGFVNNLIIVPKNFFVPTIIEKRKPLSDTAKRAGWIGCNILLTQIPQQGKLAVITNGVLSSLNDIVTQTNKAISLETKNINARGWLMDVLLCVNTLQNKVFTLKDFYTLFEEKLSKKHPDNNNVQAKIRQQLQFLRDKEFIQFLGRGEYKIV